MTSSNGDDTLTKSFPKVLQNIPPADVLILSDETHFHLSGTVNKQNFRYWAAENPQLLHQRPLNSPHVTFWCAVAEFDVLGPQFFEEDILNYGQLLGKASSLEDAI
ncbi:DUF4817 domain-containing protein [Trichonephila clavipes]|uniref:DUF4817 domain-containing protein n=1 Tax=Trichonephila clavipes TaxID=2585209 RepID=A0A8X6S376_TRICX|nr:DUF4817 domain-containing protein [Trichonephila clavipes]